jgi:hypothetical protein
MTDEQNQEGAEEEESQPAGGDASPPETSAEAAAPPPPAVSQLAPTAPSQEQAAQPPPLARKSVEERKAALAQAIQSEVVQGGRIESQSDFQAVIVFGKPVNHILHLILTVLTCGIWGVVWLGMLIWGGENRVMVSIDDYGNVLRQKIK